MTYRLTVTKPGVALVLGGSGGAGEAISRALAAAGSSLAIAYNTAGEKAQRVAKEIAATGVSASAHKINLTDAPSTIDTIRKIGAEQGIHTLVYAVGPLFTWASIGDIPPNELKDVLAIETAGFHTAVFAALPFLRTSHGSIVACTTWANTRMMPGDGLSSVPKAAIDSMMRQLAREEAQYLVRANIVGVGSTNIGMGNAENPRNMVSGISDEQWEVMLRQIPLGNRLGRGEELASAAVFFASDQASYITGQQVIVDGGLSL